MNKEKFGVVAKGIKLPIVKAGDNLKDIIVNSVINTIYTIQDHDIIGITESIVARSQNNYVTVDEIVQDIKNKIGEIDTLCIINPIYSRNRFAIVLKALARTANKKVILYMPAVDEVGNAIYNPFTGVNIDKYYEEIISTEGKECIIIRENGLDALHRQSYPVSIEGFIYCGLHDYAMKKEEWGEYFTKFITLADICSDKCEYGLLGSNKATEEKLKLFPKEKESQELIESIQHEILVETGKEVEVMIYGDGCFHSPSICNIPGTSIWEFADPVVSPAYTDGLKGSPNEIKIKAFADDKFKDLTGEELNQAIKDEIKNKQDNLVGNMSAQGTTPRQFIWLLGSLMDLVSGSGDKGTPVVLVQNYFSNYADL